MIKCIFIKRTFIFLLLMICVWSVLAISDISDKIPVVRLQDNTDVEVGAGFINETNLVKTH